MLQIAYDRTTLHAEARFYERYGRPYSVEIQDMLIAALRNARRLDRAKARGAPRIRGRWAVKHPRTRTDHPDRERWHFVCAAGRRYDFVYDRREGVIVTFLKPSGEACPG